MSFIMNTHSRYARVSDRMVFNGRLPITTYRHTTMEMNPPHFHNHNCLELGYCMNGAGIFHAGGNLYDYGAGDAVVIPEGMYHYATTIAPEGSTWDFIFLDPGYFMDPHMDNGMRILDFQNTICPRIPSVVTKTANPRIPELIGEIAREADQDQPNRELMLRCLINTLAITMKRLDGSNGQEAVRHVHTGIMERLAPALRFISANYMNPICADDIASSCSLSKSQATRLFDQAFGRTPMDYLTKYRIRVAGALLHNSDTPISSISQIVGYSTLSSFNRNFKDHMGVAPRDWRLGRADNPTRQKQR